MGINVLAQTAPVARTSQIKTNLGLVKPSMLGSSQRTEDCDTFSNLCVDDLLTIYSVPLGGYVAGQNAYGDISKADIFQLPGTTIKGVMLFFGVGKAVNTVDQFKVRIWDNDGDFANGSPGAPGTVLAETLVKYNDVKTDVANSAITYVEFNPAVAIPADSIFYAGINFGYKNGDTIALVTTMNRTGLACDGVVTAFEEWDPAYYGGGWYDYNTSWGFNGVSNIILPITCVDGCNTPVGIITKNITSTAAKIKWEVVTGAVSYKLRYKPAGTGNWTLLGPTGHTKTIEGLTESTKYVFQIKSVCGVEPKVASDWSAKYYFTTAEAKLAADLVKPLVAVYPNPTAGSVTISFSLTNESPVVLELMDVNGRKLGVVAAENFPSGHQEITFDCGSFAAGIYFLQMKTAEEVIVKKLIIE